MTRLSVFANYLNNYLKLHGDKEVLSVATACGSDNYDFKVHMADIYNGPIGTNRYTGRDELEIPKNVTLDDVELDRCMERERQLSEDYETGYDIGYSAGVQDQRTKDSQEHESERKLMGFLWAAVFAYSVINLAVKVVKRK